jgi:3-oxoacyl-[acyl-carrier protein] reductase
MPVPGATVALVTGGGRGLGRSTALALAQAGLAVGVLGRSAPAVDAVAEQIQASGGRAAAAVADVRDIEQVREAVGVLARDLGDIGLLVNNAGVIESDEVPVWEADPQEWWDVVETDLRGPFNLVRAVVPGMLARGGGRVVNLSSGAGATDREVYSAYCAAKAGLFRITGNLHLAGFAHGLRAFEISPGVVQTEMTASMPMHAGRTQWTSAQAFVDLVLAVARAELDDWSGCFLRAGIDTPQSLAAVSGPQGGRDPLPVTARRLGILPWGPDDPMAG